MARAERCLYIIAQNICCVRLESIWWRLGYPVDIKSYVLEQWAWCLIRLTTISSVHQKKTENTK